MLLQIYFAVPPERGGAFEFMFTAVYVPALQQQVGYQGSTLLRLFPPAVSQEIGAAETTFNYQMELRFDTEANRRLWVASPEHKIAWSQAQLLATDVAWRGYDVVG